MAAAIHYKLCFFVPETHVEQVKDAVFGAGAGRLGLYDRCSWQVMGTGQFRPLPGSRPFIGEAGTVEQVLECRVEMICSASHIHAAVKALVDAHPYETPAFEYWPVIVE